jgi:hypothetical protein
MKPLFQIAIFALTLFVSSCTKDTVTSNKAEKKSLLKSIAAHTLSSNQQNVYDIYSKLDFELSLMSNANYGMLSEEENENSDFYLLGKVPEDIIATIGGVEYKPGQNSQITQYNKEFSHFFGLNYQVSLKDNEKSESFTLQIPPKLTISKLGETNSIVIERTGNVFTWEGDNSNNEGILIMYNLYDSEDVSTRAKISSDYLITPDDGNFNLDELIADANVKSINLTFIRANIVNFVSHEKNVVWTFRANDHHEYIIK